MTLMAFVKQWLVVMSMDKKNLRRTVRSLTVMYGIPWR